jgi:hypothetical protein
MSHEPEMLNGHSPAAFIPAESPPEVRTAIFFCLLPPGADDGAALGAGASGEIGSNVSFTPSRSLVAGMLAVVSGESILL